eukprot:7387572-Prymnesium_polylepis.1
MSIAVPSAAALGSGTLPSGLYSELNFTERGNPARRSNRSPGRTRVTSLTESDAHKCTRNVECGVCVCDHALRFAALAIGSGQRGHRGQLVSLLRFTGDRSGPTPAPSVSPSWRWKRFSSRLPPAAALPPPESRGRDGAAAGAARPDCRLLPSAVVATPGDRQSPTSTVILGRQSADPEAQSPARRCAAAQLPAPPRATSAAFPRSHTCLTLLSLASRQKEGLSGFVALRRARLWSSTVRCTPQPSLTFPCLPRASLRAAGDGPTPTGITHGERCALSGPPDRAR